MTGSKYPFQDLLDFLMRRGRSRHAAEDLVQEAFTRLLEYRRNGGEVKNEEAFVKRTAVNLSIDEYRHHKRYPVAEGDIGDLEQTLPLIHEGPGPDEVLDVDQRLIEVRDRLIAFSKRSGEIYMAHRAGFSYKEIAAHAVEKHIARVVRWLMDRKDSI